MRPRKRNAFNLIESAIVLGVVGLVIGGVWWAAGTARDNYQIQKFAGDIYLALSKLREVYQNQRIPDGWNGAPRLLGALLPGAGYWGIKYPWSLDKTDPDGSSFYLGVIIDGDGGSGNLYEKYPFIFRVSYPDRKTCIKLVSAMIPNDKAAQEIYLVFQQANGTYYYQNAIMSSAQAFNLAQTHCKERDLSLTTHYSGGYHGVQFRFKQR